MHILAFILVCILGGDCAWKLWCSLQAGWQGKWRKAAYLSLRTLVLLCVFASWVWLTWGHWTQMAFMSIALINLAAAYTRGPLDRMRKAIPDNDW